MKKFKIVAHMHTTQTAYIFGYATSKKEADQKIEDFFGPDPDPWVVTISIEEEPSNEQKQSSCVC